MLLVCSRQEEKSQSVAADCTIARLHGYTVALHLPSHQAPTHRGSVGVILGSTVRSAYSLVQREPRMNPRAGPSIRTPMVIAAIQTITMHFSQNYLILQ